MTTDQLNRRLRFAKPKPVVRRLVLTEADLLIFEAIDRHGPLPTHYLYEFTKHLRRDYTHLQNRLTEFYNGDANGPYLTRPPQQFAGFEARYQHLVYDLSNRARTALAGRNRLCRFTPRRTDPFVHRLMTACVGASLELTASSKGLRYISREEIFARSTCPIETQLSKNPMAIILQGPVQRLLIPDDLFGIEYPGTGFRFVAVEIDRNTESLTRTNLAQTSFGRKIDVYLSILKQQVYRAQWGIPNLSMLTVTTNAIRARNITAHIKKLGETSYNGRFAVGVELSFGCNWKVPRHLCSFLESTARVGFTIPLI